jgi:uncharacterized protein YjbI with pentapeptide repeats
MAHTSIAEMMRVLEPLRLPDQAQLAAARQLAASMPGSTAQQRAEALAQRGLLGDLADLFCGPSQGSAIRNRCVADLATTIETFEALAGAINGNALTGALQTKDALTGARQTWPELRLRECRVERADLSSLEVQAALHLEHCILPSEVRLLGASFSRPARFVGSEFPGEANFFAVTFAAGADFAGAKFHGAADFRGATFSGEISFFRANFDQCLELKFAHFEPDAVLNLVEVRFRGSSVMGGSLSMGFRQFRPGLIAGEDSRDHHSLAAACEQYGELEANFAAQGSPDSNAAKDWCHYRYMDLRRQTTFGRRNPRRLLDWLFLKWCFGYGVYTRRVLYSGMAVIVLFALLYATNGLGLPGEAWSVQYAPDHRQAFTDAGHCLDSFCNAMYFSAITFATVGYGDWYPLHWARLAAAIEGLSGIFIMSVFTVSFARKIIR